MVMTNGNPNVIVIVYANAQKINRLKIVVFNFAFLF